MFEFGLLIHQADLKLTPIKLIMSRARDSSSLVFFYTARIIDPRSTLFKPDLESFKIYSSLVYLGNESILSKLFNELRKSSWVCLTIPIIYSHLSGE